MHLCEATMSNGEKIGESLYCVDADTHVVFSFPLLYACVLAIADCGRCICVVFLLLVIAEYGRCVLMTFLVDVAGFCVLSVASLLGNVAKSGLGAFITFLVRGFPEFGL